MSKDSKDAARPGEQLATKGFLIAIIGAVIATPGMIFGWSIFLLLGAPFVVFGTLTGVVGIVLEWFRILGKTDNDDGPKKS
jgi:hypothetical protein